VPPCVDVRQGQLTTRRATATTSRVLPLFLALRRFVYTSCGGAPGVANACNGESDGNRSVSRRQQITLRATLIFHLIDGLLSGVATLRTAIHLLLTYSLPRLRTKFGERAFSHASPATWNALPDNIRTVADPVKFRKLLKLHYFSKAFNILLTFVFLSVL